MNWLLYHIIEEFFISFICYKVARRAYNILKPMDAEIFPDKEKRSRIFLISAGFAILAINSFLHAVIHLLSLNQNLLYQTLLGYCLGLIILILAFFSERPWNKSYVPLLYIPLLVMLIPDVYEQFPFFGQFRPLIWIVISYLSGLVCMLYIAAYHHTRLKRYLLSSIGHMLICFSAIALFFPTGIGSAAWIFGHLIRPVGFGILFFSMNREELLNIRESLLYKTLVAFGLLSAIPLLVFGIVVIYESIHPIQMVNKQMLVFLMVLITLSCALLFGLGLIIRLIRPVLKLQSEIQRVAAMGLDQPIVPESRDEIGDLSTAFKDMVVKLQHSLSERDRLSRLAATGELAATLAHEIKNPLNAIGGAALYIEKNFKGSLIKEFVRVIYDESLRINDLTSNLLDFAKPLNTNLVPSDINALVKETVNLLEQDREEQGIQIKTELQESMPVTRFDYNQIKQVLINLLLNSFEAVNADGLITIRTGTSNGTLRLTVTDNGIGIEKESFDNIFNPFFTTKLRGTGLGLAISKKILVEHNGDITVQSTPGKGSTFTLNIPV